MLFELHNIVEGLTGYLEAATGWGDLKVMNLVRQKIAINFSSFSLPKK